MGRRRAASDLAESESEHQLALDSNPQVSWTADGNGKVASISRRWFAWTGLGGEDSVIGALARALHPDDRARTIGAWARSVATGFPDDVEHRIRKANGSFHWMRSRAVAVPDGQGNVVRWYGTTEDIDDRIGAQARARDLQAELLHSARLGAVGEVAGELIHELSQPLASIGSYIHGLLTLIRLHDPQPAAEIEDGLNLMLSETVRAGDVVRSLRRYLRAEHEGLARRWLDVGALLREAVQVGLAGTDRRRLQLYFDIPDGLRLNGDRGELVQALSNLVRNAVEAMEGCARKELTVSARLLPGVEGEAEKVEIAVADTGRGLPDPGALSHGRELFSSFSTTKVGGMGLGLSISRRLAFEHGGSLLAEPREGGGAVLRMTIAVPTEELEIIHDTR